MACRDITLYGVVSRVASALSFIHLTGNNGSKEDRNSKGFNWRDAVADGLIVAGLNFFSTLSGISITHIIVDPLDALLASLISAGLGFFTTLAFKRGLRPSPE